MDLHVCLFLVTAFQHRLLPSTIVQQVRFIRTWIMRTAVLILRAYSCFVRRCTGVPGWSGVVVGGWWMVVLLLPGITIPKVFFWWIRIPLAISYCPPVLQRTTTWNTRCQVCTRIRVYSFVVLLHYHRCCIGVLGWVGWMSVWGALAVSYTHLTLPTICSV